MTWVFNEQILLLKKVGKIGPPRTAGTSSNSTSGAWGNVDYPNLTYTQILDLCIDYCGAWGNVGYLNLTYTQIRDLFVDYLTLACRHIPSTICCFRSLFKY